MDHTAIEIDEMVDEAIDAASQSEPTGQSSSPPLNPSPFLWTYDPIAESLDVVNSELERRRTRPRTKAKGRNPSCSIFKLPATLCGINRKAEEPEIVSIGPYHRRGEHLSEFEEHKWFFLELFLARRGQNVGYYIEEMASLERRTRDCYSEPVGMLPHALIRIMLLDGCFIIELLRHLGHKEERPINESDPVFSQLGIIHPVGPVFSQLGISGMLIRDLLKLENQLPFFVLEFLFTSSLTEHESKDNDLSVLALKVFNLVFPRPGEMAPGVPSQPIDHLLHLVHLSLAPSYRMPRISSIELPYRPSDQSIPSTSQLKPSGIKFKSSKANSFLDINFRNRVLDIPSITIDDFMSTLLINCLAIEQCQESRPGTKYLTDYISFMNCLINQPKDVSLLCANGIITRFSQDDQYVANLFNKLGENLVFNVDDCYLSEQFRDVESYYSSDWATMMRTYFSSPWSFISVFSAFLIILLTAIQTVIAVVSIKWR